jgi:hypothetical protein
LVADNKLDKMFGPTGACSGYFLMLAGIATAYFFALPYLLLALAGMFMAFTCDGTQIDFDLRRIRNYSCLFGLFRIGKWHDIDTFKKFHIVQNYQ